MSNRPPLARLPAGRKEGGVKLLDIADQPLGYAAAKKRKKMQGMYAHDLSIFVSDLSNCRNGGCQEERGECGVAKPASGGRSHARLRGWVERDACVRPAHSTTNTHSDE